MRHRRPADPFVHARGHGERPLPLLLTHGYPDCFLRFRKLIPSLTDPAARGGDAADSLDVIVPSLPGRGYCGKPTTDGTLFRIGDRWAARMKELGYRKFGAHGGDRGSTVTGHFARSHADALVGIHLTDVPFAHLFQAGDPRRSEKAFFEASGPRATRCDGHRRRLTGIGCTVDPGKHRRFATGQCLPTRSTRQNMRSDSDNP